MYYNIYRHALDFNHWIDWDGYRTYKTAVNAAKFYKAIYIRTIYCSDKEIIDDCTFNRLFPKTLHANCGHITYK